MKHLLFSIAFLLYFNSSVQAQTKLVGAESYSISLPENFRRTVGTNDLATVQWEHQTKELYGYVLFENLEELKLAEINSNLAAYAQLALDDFIDQNNFKLIQSHHYKTTLGKETEEREFTYTLDDLNFHVIITIYKTDQFIYKMINFSTEETFKESKKDITYIINHIQLP